MEALKYRTRGMVRPQGKQRVYYSAHKDDLETFFDSVSTDILKHQDCAVYYSEEMGEQQEHFENLKMMQLMVFPITSKFLNEENASRNIDLKFAVENHIPVLPLIQEIGLESRFNEICGDIQCLNKLVKDSTQISFDEKLKKFLSSSLVDDRLNNRIKAAFDGHIFLSYRKKDRASAQELMKALHNIEAFQKYAVWYDEFLIPGEDYSDNIEEAVKESSLFVMAVTPSILEPSNYVLNVEYPLAKKYGKRIIPIEVIPTDRASVEALYQDMPRYYSLDRENDIKEILHELEKDSGCSINDANEISYLMGLAYLYGINSEINSELGLKYLELANENGYIEALFKLSELYYYGDRVKEDKEKAVNYSKTAIMLAKDTYRQDSCEERFKSFIKAFFTYGDYLYENKNYVAAFAPYSMACSQLLVAKRTKSFKCTDALLISALEKIGDAAYHTNDFEKAKEYHQKAYNTEIEVNGAEGFSLTLCRLCKKLSDECYELGDMKYARIFMELRVSMLELHEKDNDSFEALSDHCRSLYELANIFIKEAEHTKAEKLLFTSLRKYEELYARSYIACSQTRLFIETAPIHIMLANIHTMRGEFDEAKKIYRALINDNKIIFGEESDTYISNFCAHIGEIGLIDMKQGRYSEAVEELMQSLQNESVLLERRTPEDLHFLITTYLSICQCCYSLNDTDTAMKYLSKAIPLAKEDAERNSLESMRNLYLCTFLIGKIYQKVGDVRSAEKGYKTAIEMGHRINERRHAAESFIDLLRAYEAYADLCMSIKNTDQAYSCYEFIYNATVSHLSKTHDPFIILTAIRASRMMYLKYCRDEGKRTEIIDNCILAYEEIMKLRKEPKDEIEYADWLIQKAVLDNENVDVERLEYSKQLYEKNRSNVDEAIIDEKMKFLNKILESLEG